MLGNSFAGESYVVYGKAGGFAASINLDALDPTEGFALNGVNGYDFSGISVSAGDINGDGLSDLFIGASYADPSGRTNAGETYVVYGRKPIEGDASNNTLNGTISDDTIYAGDGNDQIFGSEGVNTLFGQNGNDTLYGGSKADYMYGGNGDDTIYASDGNNKLFGDAGDDILYSGSGNDLIDGGIGNDTLWLGGGLDTVVLASGNGFDTINNFQRGLTTLGLFDGLTFNDLNIFQRGNGTLIKVAATDQNLAFVEDVSIIIGADFVSVEYALTSARQP
jgi:Ca2+-binding RTX toxin-like protein